MMEYLLDLLEQIRFNETMASFGHHNSIGMALVMGRLLAS
jgi:hypothetical protein